MSNTIVTKNQEREELFEAFIKEIKCPFRTMIKTDNFGTKMEYMMPCDPHCAALINRADKTAYSCLRLMSVQYPLKYEHGIEIFHGLDKEED